MKTDIIGRRVRHLRQPNKLHKHIVEPRDIRWLAFLHRHGGRLPTSYLHDATKDTHKSKDYTLERLKILYQELKLIDRPFQQFETLDPRQNELVHEISPTGLTLLKQEGLYSKYAPSMKGAFKHQVMLSCVSASFEINARDRGYTYTPQHEILEKVEQDHHIKLPTDNFTPDEVFMLTIDGKSVLLFLEIDRGTEPTETGEMNRKSWSRSIRQYRQLIGHKLYKEHFGVDCGALLLVVTISKAKQDGILKAIEAEYNGPCNYMLVHHLTEFGREFHPPLLLDMLGVKWQRAGHPPFSFA